MRQYPFKHVPSPHKFTFEVVNTKVKIYRLELFPAPIQLYDLKQESHKSQLCPIPAITLDFKDTIGSYLL